eukprot:2228458-Prymnesium_polylepis.1
MPLFVPPLPLVRRPGLPGSALALPEALSRSRTFSAFLASSLCRSSCNDSSSSLPSSDGSLSDSLPAPPSDS